MSTIKVENKFPVIENRGRKKNKWRLALDRVPIGEILSVACGDRNALDSCRSIAYDMRSVGKAFKTMTQGLVLYVERVK